MLSLGTLVPKGPCCVFYATRHQVYLDLVLRLISHTDKHTHTHTHTQTHTHTHTHTTQGPID